jgi:hypothetical protein
MAHVWHCQGEGIKAAEARAMIAFVEPRKALASPGG